MALCQQLRRTSAIDLVGNTAAAEALIGAPSGVHAVQAFIESFWGYIAQLSASGWIGRVSAES